MGIGDLDGSTGMMQISACSILRPLFVSSKQSKPKESVEAERTFAFTKDEIC